MSLVPRQPRPLIRGTGRLRDDRLFIVACDDTYAPKQYFDFFRLARVQIHVIASEGGEGHARHVLDRLLTIDHEDDDERWLLLDTNHYAQKNHLPSFLEAIGEAKRQGVTVAISKPCFELWLLLHHVDHADVTALATAAAEQMLRAKLGEYNKTNLKPEHYPLASVCLACKRAEALNETVAGGEIPQGNTSRVYQLWKSIVAKALPSQLPAELRSLMPPTP